MELATRYLSGRWTRSAFDGGQLLAICRQCGKFAGDHCEKFTPAEFVATLCDATRRCKQWGPLTIPAC